MTQQFDMIILGGGMVGLMLANLLHEQPLHIAIVDPQPPQLQWPSDDYPLRVSAINRASQQLFQNLTLWDDIKQAGAAPYEKMVVWDAGSSGYIQFDAADIGATDLGAIVPNRVMRRALWQQLQNTTAHAKVQLFCPHQAKQFVDLGQQRMVVLNDGTRIQAPLIVGADGARSWLRREVGICCKEGFYDEQGIVAVVKHEKPHERTAWQRFLPTGPLAFLPCADEHTSSIVWSCETDKAQALQALPEAEFNTALTEAFEYRLGAVELLSQRAGFPLSYRHAHAYVVLGVALIGDAAHGIHPLAGQGVNLGYADATVLADTLQQGLAKHQPLGDFNLLKHYERQRRIHNEIAMQAMTGFDKLFSNDQTGLKLVRGIGLNLTDKANPLKKWLMALAMGEV